MLSRMRRTSSSVRSFVRVATGTAAFSQMFLAVVLPIPKMYWSEISMRFSRGRSSPAMRAILVCAPLCPKKTRFEAPLPLALLVTWIGRADDPHDALAFHDLALVADLLHRGADLHDATASPFSSCGETKSPAASFRRDKAEQYEPPSILRKEPPSPSIGQFGKRRL